MPLIPRVYSLWRHLAHPDRVDRDLDDEGRAAFDLLVDEKIRGGMLPENARRPATLEFGQVQVVKAHVRDVRAGAREGSGFCTGRLSTDAFRPNPSVKYT